MFLWVKSPGHVEFNGLHILAWKCFGELFTARRRSVFMGLGNCVLAKKAVTTALGPVRWVISIVFDNFEAFNLDRTKLKHRWPYQKGFKPLIYFIINYHARLLKSRLWSPSNLSDSPYNSYVEWRKMCRTFCVILSPWIVKKVFTFHS